MATESSEIRVGQFWAAEMIFDVPVPSPIPSAEIKIFPRGGHALTQVRAREFNQAVLPFLASHTPG